MEEITLGESKSVWPSSNDDSNCALVLAQGEKLPKSGLKNCLDLGMRHNFFLSVGGKIYFQRLSVLLLVQLPPDAERSMG